MAMLYIDIEMMQELVKGIAYHEEAKFLWECIDAISAIYEGKKVSGSEDVRRQAERFVAFFSKGNLYHQKDDQKDNVMITYLAIAAEFRLHGIFSNIRVKGEEEECEFKEGSELIDRGFMTIVKNGFMLLINREGTRSVQISMKPGTLAHLWMAVYRMSMERNPTALEQLFKAADGCGRTGRPGICRHHSESEGVEHLPALR